MIQPQVYTSWSITCPSVKDCQALQRWLTEQIDLNRIVTATERTLPHGVEQTQSVNHRLGDYFATITADTLSPASLCLTFHRLAQAGRYWKDLMVGIVRQIESLPLKPVIALEYKGDDDPRAAAKQAS